MSVSASRALAASVYRRRDRLLFNSSSQTEGRYGLWIGSPPYSSLTADASAEVIGATLLKTLEGSRGGLPRPADPDTVIRPLLEQAGVPTWSEFMRGAITCRVERDKDGFRFLPYTNDGRGFVPGKEDAVQLSNEADAAQVGQALLRALAACR